jgi:eukaryotic-like serine/threonine-protein kinase
MVGLESLLRGRVLAGRYRIEEVIGRGGMGAVYRALDERLGRAVAVKVITAAASGGDPEARERIRARFRHEAAAAAKLPHHPNVVPVYDYGTDDELGLDFIVMELLRGEDLATRLQRAGAPPLGVALLVLRDAARGVAVGHRMSVIHRDVKPGNVFLVEDEHGGEMQVRVLDFGIAKVIAEEDTSTALTHDGRAPLSPAYASPEQLRGEPRLTPASDVFSLGAVGFQLLTGSKPFTEADRNRLSIGMDVPVPSIRARNPAVPPPVEEVVRKAMAYDAEQRYPNASAFADAVDALIRQVDATPAASAVPAVAGPVVTDDVDDRTALAGDDRTMLAPVADDDRTMLAPVPPASRSAGAAAAAGAGAGAAGAGAGAAGAGAGTAGGAAPSPVMPPPRRRAEPARAGVSPVIWVVLLLVLGGAGVFAMQAMNADRGQQAEDPLAALPDSAPPDTVEQGDTLTAGDAPRLDAEGRRLLRERDYAGAVELLREAVELDPQRAEFRDHLAVALMRMGRHEESARVLEEAIRIDRTYDRLYSHLYEARLAQADTAGAVQALRLFLEVSLDRAARQEAQDRLEELTAPKPVVPEPPQIFLPPTDVDTIPQLPDAPRDTIVIRNPG